ncbi:hypothetical protein J6E39_06755 [bacterium]|nr:hypothetical protein [bacterium]
MREINNQQPGNMPQPISSKKVDVKENLTEDIKPEISSEPQKEIKDLANMPAETLGRSQVTAPDTIENDIKMMIENPEAIEKANKFYDMAEKVLASKGDPEAAEKATLLADAYRKEFLAK